MNRIRYLALLSPEPDALAAFYTRHFAMKELGRSPDGDVTLSDGGYKLTLMRLRPELREPHMAPGYHHLGIAVDDIDAVVARYRARYPRGTVVPESNDLHHGAVRIFDPECNPVTLSANGFGLAPDPSRALPRISHIALNALDPEAVFTFYSEIFGFRELLAAHAERRKDPTYRNRHVGDGFTNVAIQAFYNTREGHEARFGIAHMGFLVGDMDRLVADIAASATVARRPSERVQSEVRMRDPQGNACDLSRRGWEVDTDTWARAEIA